MTGVRRLSAAEIGEIEQDARRLDDLAYEIFALIDEVDKVFSGLSVSDEFAHRVTVSCLTASFCYVEAAAKSARNVIEHESAVWTAVQRAGGLRGDE